MAIDWEYEASRCAFPEHRGEIAPTDPPPMGPTPRELRERDADLERDWAWLAAELREFTAKHGLAGMLRCVADSVRETK